MLDELIDLSLEISDRVERSSPDCLVGDQSKPTLYLVEPGAIRWGVVQMETWAARQPGFHPGMLVRAVVVADKVYIEGGRDIGLDVAQENRQFFSLAGLNAAIGELLVGLNTRAFKKLPGSRAGIFQALDQPAMKPSAAFLGFEPTSEQWPATLEFTSFPWMKRHEHKFEARHVAQLPTLDSGAMVRKGKAGVAREDGVTLTMSGQLKTLGKEILTDQQALDWLYAGGTLC